MKIYTGIGSRETPDDVIELMTLIGSALGSKGYTLYSGGALGADTAFETGCDRVGGQKRIFLPWKGFGKKHGRVESDSDCFTVPTEAKEEFNKLVEEYGDFNKGCATYIWSLMERNMLQILGPDLSCPSSGVVCWTPNGLEKGGTRWAIRLAKKKGITVYNLAIEDVRCKFESMVRDHALFGGRKVL